MIKASLESAVDTPDINLGPSVVEDILVKCISDIDDRINADLVNFFPGGLEQISEMSDDEIKSIIKDPETENSYVQILRARTGTTALISLIDPSSSLHIASLGDCEARKHKNLFVRGCLANVSISSWYAESTWSMGSEDLEQSTQCQ
jgi:hypothetical protein